jgi:hypothetical protein
MEGYLLLATLLGVAGLGRGFPSMAGVLGGSIRGDCVMVDLIQCSWCSVDSIATTIFFNRRHLGTWDPTDMGGRSLTLWSATAWVEAGAAGDESGAARSPVANHGREIAAFAAFSAATYEAS